MVKSIKSSLIEVEAAVDADAQCSASCPVSPGSSTTAKCGGPGGLVSVYTSFKAFSTLDLVLEVTDLENATVATTVNEVKDAPKKVSTGEVLIPHELYILFIYYRFICCIVTQQNNYKSSFLHSKYGPMFQLESIYVALINPVMVPLLKALLEPVLRLQPPKQSRKNVQRMEKCPQL